jgi:hypothetical protein
LLGYPRRVVAIEVEPIGHHPTREIETVGHRPVDQVGQNVVHIPARAQ